MIRSLFESLKMKTNPDFVKTRGPPYTYSLMTKAKSAAVVHTLTGATPYRHDHADSPTVWSHSKLAFSSLPLGGQAEVVLNAEAAIAHAFVQGPQAGLHFLDAPQPFLVFQAGGVNEELEGVNGGDDLDGFSFISIHSEDSAAPNEEAEPIEAWIVDEEDQFAQEQVQEEVNNNDQLQNAPGPHIAKGTKRAGVFYTDSSHRRTKRVCVRPVAAKIRKVAPVRHAKASVRKLSMSSSQRSFKKTTIYKVPRLYPSFTWVPSEDALRSLVSRGIDFEAGHKDIEKIPLVAPGMGAALRRGDRSFGLNYGCWEEAATDW